MLSNIYYTLLSQPLLNLLIFLYDILFNNIALAIIAVTLLIRGILYPSFKHQLESQKKLSEIQPKLQELRNKHKDNPEAQSKAMMDFYKTNKVNPLSSCLPMVIQLVILLALYRVFLNGLNGEALSGLYPFVSNPGTINPTSFGVNWGEKSLILAVITGAVQYFQSKMMLRLQPQTKPTGDKSTDMASSMTKQMVYFFPIITVVIGAQLPAGLVLYWFITTLFAIFQQWLIIRGKSNNTPDVLPAGKN